MKKIYLSLITLILVCTLSIFVNIKINASTPDAYMIVANPGEDSSIEMNIGWHTDLKNTESYVIYTTKDDTDWSEQIKVKGTYKKVDVFNGISSKDPNGKDIKEDAIFLDYNVTLTNLIPNTEYMYKVGQNILSEPQYFKTAGSNNFSFAWISDFHAYDPLPARLNNAMKMLETLDKYNNGFDFVFSTGDEIAWGGSYSHWIDIFEQKYHKNYMWASVIGNHDYMDRTSTKSSNEFFKTVYSYPTNGYEGEEGVCYYFKYSNVLFITMNNETQKNAAAIKKAQDWFEDVVTKNPSQYIVVAQHYQWFEGITGKFNESSGYGRWKELFDKYQVDLAMAGNNHIYVRSKLLYQDKVSKDYNYGTTYIQASSSDNERGQTLKDLSYNKDVIEYRFSEGGKTVSGIVVNVTEEGIKIELVDRNGKLLDTGNIKARRDVNPMNNFDKQQFEKSIKFIPSKYEDKALLSFDEYGIGYVKNIEIKKDGNVLTQTNFKRNLDTIQTIPNLSKNAINELDIVITYKDNTVTNLKQKVITGLGDKKLFNNKVEITNSGYKITFNDSNIDFDKVEIYMDNTLQKTLSKGINVAEINCSSHSIFTKFKLIAYISDIEVDSLEFNYYSSKDINLDGKFDGNDIKQYQELITTSFEKDNQNLYYYDMNNDGLLDIEDVIYVAMALENNQGNLKKQFEVIFKNQDGKILGKVLVDENAQATFTPPVIDGYVFVGWDNEGLNITNDTIMKAIFIKGE